MTEATSEKPMRIPERELEYSGDVRLLGEVPFTGISYEVYPDGQLEQETIYKDGLPEGLQREWYSNGRLRKESDVSRGLGATKVTSWYESGNLRSISIYESGVRLEYKEWSDDTDSELVVDEVTEVSPALKTYMERMAKVKKS
ncbi:toxin-antitoxin system YwqK family antitoxin [Agaribacter flavus]|uniref:Toxin-antitoxin system YwqK family antitoxin n=1 Tax=Agaribacter flavus TaxID=1902781 RepID=A0ABV7FND9_9ALTE